MTTQYVRTALGATGLSGLVCKLIDTTNTDTVSYTSDSVSAATNAVGTYVFTFGESAVIPQQWWRIVVVDGSGNLRGDGFGYFLGTDGELVEGVSQPVRSSVPTTTTPTVERSVNDTKAIAFAWPVSGATITGQRSTNQGSYTSLSGAISYLRQDGDVYWYSLAYNAADRDTAENNIRYKFTDGTYTRWLNLRLTGEATGIAAIKAKTDNLPSDPADQSAVEAAITAAIATVPTAAENADAVWDEAMADHTGSTTYGGRIVRATNSNVTVQITGSNHISADVHAFQTDVIDATAIAASAVTEIQTGLATSANQTTILDRQAYTLAVLAGACSDPQTASETYVLTIGGSTYTVDMAGQTSTGTRTAPTLTKT